MKANKINTSTCVTSHSNLPDTEKSHYLATTYDSKCNDSARLPESCFKPAEEPRITVDAFRQSRRTLREQHINSCSRVIHTRILPNKINRFVMLFDLNRNNLAESDPTRAI
jgi:hypothetical protein